MSLTLETPLTLLHPKIVAAFWSRLQDQFDDKDNTTDQRICKIIKPDLKMIN